MTIQDQLDHASLYGIESDNDYSYDYDVNEYHDSVHFMIYCDTYACHDRYDY